MTAPNPTPCDRALDAISDDPLGLKITQQNWRRRLVPWLAVYAVAAGIIGLGWFTYDSFMSRYRRYAEQPARRFITADIAALAKREGRSLTQAEWLAADKRDNWGHPRLYVAPETLDAAGARPRLFSFVQLNLGTDGVAFSGDDRESLSLSIPAEQFRRAR